MGHAVRVSFLRGKTSLLSCAALSLAAQAMEDAASHAGDAVGGVASGVGDALERTTLALRWGRDFLVTRGPTPAGNYKFGDITRSVVGEDYQVW